MAGIPSVVVEMNAPDSSSGWLDVSDYVDLKRGIRCGRGRSNEFETSAPGTASFTVINKTSDFWAPGGAFSDIGYGLMRKNAHVRFKVAGLYVWRGRVDSIKINADAGSPISTLEIACTDEFKTYAKARLYPFALETCKADVAWTGGAVYPLIQPSPGVGSYWAALRDPSIARLKRCNGTAGVINKSVDGPPHIKGGVKIQPKGQIGPVFEHPTTWNPGAAYGLVSFWFRTEADETSYLFSMERTSGGSGYAAIWINATTGRLTFTCAGDSGGSATLTPTGAAESGLFDGAWHHVAAWFHTGSGTTIRAYIDGVLQSTATSGGTACTIGSGNRRAVFGGKRNSAWTDNTYVLNGDIAAPAVWTYSATTDAPSYWYGHGMNADADNTIANRLTDLAAFVGLTAPSTSSLSGYQIAGQDTAGKSYLDAVQEIAASEMGVFYVDRLGAGKLRGYGARSSAVGVDLTVSATQDLAGEASLVLDDATYANTVRATSDGGSVVVQDSTLLAADGAEIVDEWQTLTYSETNLETMADNRLALRSSNVFRLGRVSIDLLTTPNSIGADTIRLIPLDRVQVTSLDADIFGDTTYDGFVEGWELIVSTDEYTVNLDLSPVI